MTNAKDWRNRPIETWNTTTFHAYLSDEHRRLFGVDYAPMRGWRTEQGLLGNLIGTKTKAGTADKAQVKAFIDECFATYRPTAEWPGISFGFMWAYRKNVWQRIQAESQRKAQAEQKKQTIDFEKLADWL